MEAASLRGDTKTTQEASLLEGKDAEICKVGRINLVALFWFKKLDTELFQIVDLYSFSPHPELNSTLLV